MRYIQPIPFLRRGIAMLLSLVCINVAIATGGLPAAATPLTDADKSSSSSTHYTPLMEIGKSWKYRLIDECGIEELRTPAKDWMLRVDGTREIDGDQWFIVNAYERAIGEDSYKTPVTYAYVHEDVALRQVRVLASEAVGALPTKYDPITHYPNFNTAAPEKGALVFDFINPENSAVVRESKYGFTDDWSYLTPAGNTLKGFATSKLAMIEGLGLMQKATATNENLSQYPVAGSFLGERIIYLAGFQGGDYKAMLYEIAAPNGTILYSYDKNRDLETNDIAEVDKNNTSISIEGDQVVITVANGSAIGNIQVVNEAGIVVRDFQISTSRYIFNVTGYSPGVYLIRAAGIVRRIAVK